MRGLASPKLTHGRYSKDLTTDLARRAAEARTNPQLLSLSDDLAVLEARLAECFATVRQGDSEAFWTDLRGAFAAFSKALDGGNQADMRSTYATLQQLIRTGGEQSAAWGEIRKLWETRCKMVQTEVKTLQGLQQLVTVQQMQLHLGAVTNVVLEACTRFVDAATRRPLLTYILNEFNRLSTLPGERPEDRARLGSPHAVPGATEET